MRMRFGGVRRPIGRLHGGGDDEGEEDEAWEEREPDGGWMLHIDPFHGPGMPAHPIRTLMPVSS
jgi:hypothetical protein